MLGDAKSPALGSGKGLAWSVLILCALLLCLAEKSDASLGVDAYWGSISQSADPSGGRFDNNGPYGVAINDPSFADGNGADGDVYVADSGFNRIQQFSADGDFIRAWGFDVDSANPSIGYEICTDDAVCKAGITSVSPAPGGELSAPAGITVDQANGHVYVNDRAFNRVQEFDSAGGFVRAFGQDVVSAGPGNSGTGFEICIAANGDTCKAGSSTGGAGGVINSSSSVPAYLAVAPEGAPNAGDLLVPDPTRNRIQEFSGSGGFVRAFGGGVVNGGAEGTGNVTSGSTQITGVSTAAKFFVAGQSIAGAGIPAGTRIASVAAGGIINLTQAATATNPSTPIDAAAGAGNVANNEIQQISLGEGVVSGNFKLSFVTPAPNNTTAAANTTANIPFDATAGTVEGALESLGNIGAGNIAVTGPVGGPWVVEFIGKFADTNVNLVGQAAGSPPLSAGTVSRMALVEGASGFEVCESVADCQAGVAGTDAGSFGAQKLARVAEDPSGNIYTVETQEGGLPSPQRVQKFSLPGNVVSPQGAFACAILCAENAGALDRNNPTNVAVDGQGFVYVVKAVRVGEGDPPVVSENSNWQDRVLKFDPAGNLVESINANTGSEPGVEGDGSLGNRIRGISGLAPTASGSRLYLSTAFNPLGDAGRSRIYRFGEISGPSGSASTGGVGATAATLEATISPASTLGNVKTFYRFEYRRQGTTDWTRSPSADVNIGNGSDGSESSACSPQLQAATCHVRVEVDALELGRTYEYRLVARTSYRGALLTSVPQEFTTTAVPPTVTTGSAVWSGPPAIGASPSLTFNGRINPQGANTTYAFEYVEQKTFQESGFSQTRTAPLRAISAGHGTKTLDVTVAKGGLDASRGYRFRLVASNPSGTTTGATGSIGPAHAGDRFLELVSDGDSQGGDVSSAVTISDDGERVAFTSIAFGDDQQAAHWIVNPAIAKRGVGGWMATAMAGDPSRDGSGNLAPLGGTGNAEVTERLWGTSPAPQTVQWAVRQLDGGLVPISPVLSPLDRSGFFSLNFLGGSNNLDALVLSNGPSGSTLFPGEPLLQGGASNLYKVSGAGSESPTVSLLNLGEGGGTLGGACGATLGTREVRTGAVSADGSIVYFSASPVAPSAGVCAGGGSVGFFFAGDTVLLVTSGSFSAGQLISGQGIAPGTTVEAVDHGANTITISTPTVGIGNFFGTQLAASFPTRIFKRAGEADPVEVAACTKTPPGTCPGGSDQFWGASGNGSKVFFTTARQLVDTDTDSTADLYVYDSSLPPSERLAQASAGEAVDGDHPSVGSGADVQGVVDLAMDGSRVYFVAQGRLTTEASAGANNLYVYQRDESRPSGRIAFIGTLAAGTFQPGQKTDPRLWADSGNSTGEGKPAYALPRYEGVGEDRSDGNGSLLVFVSGQALLPSEDHDSVNDLYRYNDATGQLMCLSCAGNAADPVSISGRNVSSASPDQIQRERVASEDGSAVAFSTKEALLPDDTNTVEDVYVWNDQTIALVSGATAGTGVSYSEAGGGPAVSPDGNSVFFATRATILPQDLDNGARDIYVARVDGGFPQEETPVPCASEDDCHGPNPKPPVQPQSPASAALSGPGNVSDAATRCSRTARQARKLSRRAKGLQRRARHLAQTPARRAAARNLNRKARRLARKAQGLSRSAKRCRAGDKRRTDR